MMLLLKPWTLVLVQMLLKLFSVIGHAWQVWVAPPADQRK